MIKTKSIHSPKDKEDGMRILITRFYPRGVKRERYDVWMRELAPSAKLLRQYKDSQISWDDFEAKLLDEFQNNPDTIQAINTLRSSRHTKDITLLCHEKDGLPCHRYIVRDLIVLQDSIQG